MLCLEVQVASAGAPGLAGNVEVDLSGSSRRPRRGHTTAREDSGSGCSGGAEFLSRATRHGHEDVGVAGVVLVVLKLRSL